MRRIITIVVVLVIGVLLGLFSNHGWHEKTAEQTNTRKPLYWVAPMNPSFHSDKPGKSPMGMDLVPVYANDENTGKSSPGTVQISPTVENNLGVRLAKVQQRPWESTLSTVGIVTIDPNQQVNVTPRVSGWIERQFVNAEGEEVIKGQPLYTLYSPDLVNAQRELLVALRQQDRAMITASEQRLRALQVPAKVITQLKQQRHVLQSITIDAPASGAIVKIAAKQGDFVKPGERLFSIANLDKLWVNAELFAQDAASLTTNANASVTVDGVPGQKWQEKIDYIYPEVDPKRRTTNVRIILNNTDGALKPNMYAHVRLVNHSHTPTLQVPAESVIRTGSEDRVVMTDGDGRFKSVAVTLGRVNNQYIEIKQGLQAGDQIVSSAQFLIDSESNIDSDLKRMTSQTHATSSPQKMAMKMDMSAAPTKAKTSAEPMKKQAPGQMSDVHQMKMDTKQHGGQHD